MFTIKAFKGNIVHNLSALRYGWNGDLHAVVLDEFNPNPIFVAARTLHLAGPVKTDDYDRIEVWNSSAKLMDTYLPPVKPRVAARNKTAAALKKPARHK